MHRKKLKQIRRTRPKLLWVLLLFIALTGVGFGIDRLNHYLTKPQAILVLGGDHTREQYAAQFALEHPHLPIWVSSGSNQDYAEWVFDRAGIPRDRLHLDYQAVDTVTNFTTMVKIFADHRVHSVYLITSDYHMRRARVIGTIVFGSQHITMHPVEVPSRRAPEPVEKSIRDGVRSLVWLFTGRTGVRLAP
jgi:uncharacterized SAM-binding protein YcdF (DUF218 family)